MEDIKPIVAENLAKLRKSQGLTQAQLAEKFNYSDKAVCRWERGETLPDINVLYSLCEFYGITMNDLVSAELETEEIDVDRKSRFKYRILISILLVSVVWLAATFYFIVNAVLDSGAYWVVFIWAVPISCLAVLVNFRSARSIVFRSIIYSVIVWSGIASVYFHLLYSSKVNAWMIFIIGAPLEFVIILWQQLKSYRTPK